MFEVLRFVLRRAALSVADRAVTSPLFSWTWSGGSKQGFTARLTDFRATDSQTVIEMMNGQYLLAGRVIDTEGVSPFAVETDAQDWLTDLHSFGWLRHFRDLRDPGQRRFARTLVLDWIGRYGDFERDAWDVFVTARRVLNWLKLYALLTEDAGVDQVRAISGSLAIQIQSLKLRAPLAREPNSALMAAIALVGASLCANQDDEKELFERVSQLERELNAQLDADGQHRSRNPHSQIQLLSELIPVNQLLNLRHGDKGSAIARKVEAMHRAMDRLILGTSEPGYFNGSGQIPVELVISIAAQSGMRSTGSGLSGGYGILTSGDSKLVADSGLVPPIEYSSSAHAGGLSFEFACGGDLIAGNCGPAPAQLPESQILFRHSSAHSAPTIDDVSSARIGGQGILSDRLRPAGPPPQIAYLAEENTIDLRCHAYRARYGLDIVRRLTLMSAGQTLVGQDSFVAASKRAGREGDFSIRFHLAPGVALERSDAEDLIVMRFRSGRNWAFIWEGAHAEIEESVRHSAHFGLLRTRQIVLSGVARAGHEIAWVFTRQ